MEDRCRVILCAGMVSTQLRIWVVRLTRRFRFVGQVPRRLAAEVSRRWPAQLGYLPGGATIEPCGCLDHSKQPSTRSECRLAQCCDGHAGSFTSSPQRSASLSLPLALRQMASSCCRSHYYAFLSGVFTEHTSIPHDLT
jgi:hypothetical protein